MDTAIRYPVADSFTLPKATTSASASATSSVAVALRSPLFRQQQQQQQTSKSTKSMLSASITASTTGNKAVKPFTWSPSKDDEVVQTNYIICGGGPAGLLSAIMLAQKFPNVRTVQ